MNRHPEVKRVMVIDDEPFILKILAVLLNNLGFSQVVCFESASAALATLETADRPIDLVFCDLQMPEIDGVLFVRHLVRIGYRGWLVLMSGESERILQTAEKLAQVHGLNILGTLSKPISPSRLHQVLEREIPYVRERARPPDHKNYTPEALRRALANGELINHYQPKIEIATATVTGVETLVRWQHPEDGMVLPDQFIPMAEDHDLIDDLTATVLNNALNHVQLWRDAGLSLQIAVNVSMSNLSVLEFPDMVARKAHAAGVPLTHLILEVTESRLMKDPVAPLDILTRLRLKHVGLSIDDFGTGHSSLAQLRDIPFDELKIDRSFVHGAARNTALRTIAEASLGMARDLGLKTVAEGVEDPEDWQFLRAAGCGQAQGYLIAKPMPAADLANWILSWQKRNYAWAPSARADFP